MKRSIAQQGSLTACFSGCFWRVFTPKYAQKMQDDQNVEAKKSLKRFVGQKRAKNVTKPEGPVRHLFAAGKNCRGTIFAPVLLLNYPHHEGSLGTIWGTI